MGGSLRPRRAPRTRPQPRSAIIRGVTPRACSVALVAQVFVEVGVVEKDVEHVWGRLNGEQARWCPGEASCGV
jgi:hypothetical protein